VLLHSVIDTTAHSYQGINPMIDEMRAAAKKEQLREISLPKKPVLMIISQGKGNAVLPYAYFLPWGIATLGLIRISLLLAL